MCGIAGLIGSDLALEERGFLIKRMTDTMIQRGPDDSGAISVGDASLGMRRLAIFDPANGHQPMSTPDGRYHLVFNGAIYNFRELRRELSAVGCIFRTDCDTEVLLAAYAQWGDACLGRLRGMFAFAVWDTRDERLFLARDPFGIKPLYYHQQGGEVIFASEIRAVLASGRVAAEIDPQSVADYLAWLAVPAPRTIYRGIFSLRPGECASFARGRLTIRSAWNFSSAAASPPCRTREEFTVALRGRLEDSIRAHMVADVPVGAFLSGGLDSAAVVGLMSRLSGQRLTTFSIGFEESEYSEAAAAAETARHFGAEHRASVLTGAQVSADLNRLLAALDQPTGDGVNTYYASKAARDGGVTVALSGLGGDELFGGYPSFQVVPKVARWLPWWHRLPTIIRNSVISSLRTGGARHRKLADILLSAHTVHEVGAMQRRVFSEPRRHALMSPGVLAEIGSLSPFHPELEALARELAPFGYFQTVSAWELRTYMADVLLRDSDVMSMSHSLELRVPFLDRPLVEWLWHQPDEFKCDARQPKSPLADALRDLLPPGLAHRRKRGFSLPFAAWMHRELSPFLADTFSAETVRHSGLFNDDAVQDLWRAFRSRDDDRQWSRVWSLAVMISFANRRPAIPLPGAAPVRIAADSSQRPPSAGPSAHKSRRTLLMAPEIFASEGGIPRILQIYLKALCELAEPCDAVRLLALNDSMIDPASLRRCTSDRLESWRVCNRNKIRFVRSALGLSRDCDRVICGHIFQLPVALAARALNPRLRYYLVAHGIEIWRDYRPSERLALRGAEKILCVSEYTRRQLLARCPLPPERVVVLPNALDPFFEITPGRPLRACPPTILVITRLTRADRYKGVEHMIQAMPAIRAELPAARLRIVGRGDDLPYLQQLRDNLALGDAVEFLGYVDDHRLKEELRSCRLFALPSKKEGFGLVFLEAMANSRPCLGARAGGVPEVINDASGVLVEFGDLPGIARAAVGALQRDWDESAILDRAREFSFLPFKERLASLVGLN